MSYAAFIWLRQKSMTSKAFKRWSTLTLVLVTGLILGLPRLRDRFIRSSFAGPLLIQVLERFKDYQDFATPAPLRPDYAQALYQLMQDVHDVMDACKIPYWIEAGTLLGAVRHQGLIPWDDDLDIQVHDFSAKDIASKAIPLFHALGYATHPLPEQGGIKVHWTDTYFRRLPHETLPACDIFFAREKRGGILSIWGSNKVMRLTTLHPLKLYSFGPLQVWGPHHPFPYLKSCYGKNWKILAKRGNDHLTDGKASSHHYFLLRDLSPLLPPRPLEDHKGLIRKSLSKP